MKTTIAVCSGLVIGLVLGFGVAVMSLEPTRDLPAPTDTTTTAGQAADAAAAALQQATSRIEKLENQLQSARDALASEQNRASAATPDPAGDELPAHLEAESPPGRGGGWAHGGGGSAVPMAEGVQRDRWGLPIDEQLTPEQILLLMNSENPRDVLRGLRALEQLPDLSQAVELARQNLEGGQPWLRLQAMESLVELEGPAAATTLAPLLQDDVDWVARRVARKLGELADPAGLAPLREAYETGDGRMRLESARALRELGDSGPINEIASTAQAELTNQDGNLRADAIRTLSSLEDIAYNVNFVSALSDTNSGVRRNAARALARQGTSSELPALQRLLIDPVDDVRRNAERAIRFIQNPEARNEEGDGRWGRW